MRLKNIENDSIGLELKSFYDWILSVGNVTIGIDNKGYATIEVPDDLLVTTSDDPIQSFVESTYPLFPGSFDDMCYSQKRAILAPTLDVVQIINDYMVAMNREEGRTYFSSDSLYKAAKSTGLFESIHSTEFLKSVKSSSVPNHKPKLKVGVPVNMDPAIGLCNGTRLLITRLGDHILEAKILTGSNAGDSTVVLRMSLTPSDVRQPFKFERKQFLSAVSYAMMINKSQE